MYLPCLRDGVKYNEVCVEFLFISFSTKIDYAVLSYQSIKGELILKFTGNRRMSMSSGWMCSPIDITINLTQNILCFNLFPFKWTALTGF